MRRMTKFAVTLSPSLSEGSLLAAVPDARPLIHNGTHRSYLLSPTDVNGREFRPSVYFNDGSITAVHLTWVDPEVQSGSAWENHSFERERMIAREDKKWLAATLEGLGTMTDTYTLPWGTLSSGFDERSGFSSVVVRYG